MDKSQGKMEAAPREAFYILPYLLAPLVIIYFLWMYNPESGLFFIIEKWTGWMPAFLSSGNPQLSKALDVYTKTSIISGCCVFIKTLKKAFIKTDKSLSEIFLMLFLNYIFYGIFIYFMMLTDSDMYSLGKLYVIFRMNDFFLTLFFILLYMGTYFLTWFSLTATAATIKLMIGRR